MELIKHVNAYMALSALSKEKYSYKDAYSIIKLKNELKEDFEFFGCKEREIVAKTSKKGTAKGNYFEFADSTAKEEYERAMLELSILEVKDVNRITIRPPEKITPEMLEALEAYVEFKEEQDAGTS